MINNKAVIDTATVDHYYTFFYCNLSNKQSKSVVALGVKFTTIAITTAIITNRSSSKHFIR